MSAPKIIRSSYRWKTARKIALRGAKYCAICGGALDFAAPPRSRWSPSVDHILELALGGAPFAQSNLRVTHLGCNASAGAAMGNRRRPRVAAVQAPRSRPRRATWW